MGQIVNLKSMKDMVEELASELIEGGATESLEEIVEFIENLDIRKVGTSVPMTNSKGELLFSLVVLNKDYNGANYSVIASLSDPVVEAYVKGELDIDDQEMLPVFDYVRTHSASEFKVIDSKEYKELLRTSTIENDLRSEEVLDAINDLLIIAVTDTIDRLGLNIEPHFYRRNRNKVKGEN